MHTHRSKWSGSDMVGCMEAILIDLMLMCSGRIAHAVFMTLCLINNIFACTNMLLGAAAVISAM